MEGARVDDIQSAVSSPSFATSIAEKPLRELLVYWEEKRGSRRSPARGDIDPVEIPQLLPHLLLADTAPSLSEFRYRLYGTAVCRGFRFDRTHVSFGKLPAIENYADVYEGYWKTYADAIPVYYQGLIRAETGEMLSYCRLTLPLSEDQVTVNMILGAAIFH